MEYHFSLPPYRGMRKFYIMEPPLEYIPSKKTRNRTVHIILTAVVRMFKNKELGRAGTSRQRS